MVVAYFHSVRMTIFPGSTKTVKARQTIFLRTFREGRRYFLSAPFIAAEAEHHEESHLIYGPLESTLIDQGFPDEHELDACNPAHTGIPSCRI